MVSLLRPKSMTLVCATAVLFGASPLWAGLSPGEVGDISPLGAPDGVVDEADVELVLRAIAGDLELDVDSMERADAAPVVPIDPPGIIPQRVRPNPNPIGPLDIGDAVILARRAAGLIIFDQVNQAPTVTLEGGGIVSDSYFLVSGRVADDNPIAGGTVNIEVGDVLSEGVTITPDQPGALEGSFSLVVTLLEPTTEITVRARDADGRLGPPATIQVILDQEPPLLTVSSPPDWHITRESEIEVSGTASDPSGVLVEVDGLETLQLPPDLWGATVPLAAENENVLVVVAHDGASPPNVTTVTLVVVKDTTAPVLTPDALPPAVGTSTYPLSGDVGDAWGIDSVLVDGQPANVTWDPVTQSGRWTAEVAVFEGENEYVVEAVDLAGNRTTAVPLVLQGDFVFPEVTLVSPAFVPAAPTNVTLEFSETIYFERFGAQVFSPALLIETGTHTLAGVALVEGPNTFVVRVSDVAGNTTVEEIVITLDTIPPALAITRVYNAAFLWDPEDGLDGVITNAPTATVEGTVTDVGGLAGVQVNGFHATVDAAAGTFIAVGLPLIPRDNNLVAIATDLAGNTSSDSVAVLRDAEGPSVSVDLARAAYVSTISPSPAPFNVAPLPARYYLGTGDLVVTGSASDPFYTGWVESLMVRLDGQARPVTGSAPFDSFTFTLPAALLADPGMHVVEIESFDAMGNRTLDVQAMLAGQWFTPGSTIMNAVGLGIGPEGLTAISPLLEQQIEALHPITSSPPFSFSSAGVTIVIHGIGFCIPPGNPVYPPYNCIPNVTVTLGLTAQGQVSIVVQIPRLYAGIRTTACFFTNSGYMRAQNTTISMRANFVNTGSGVVLEPVDGSVNVNIGDLTITANNVCADVIFWMLGPWLEGIVADAFEDQIPALLQSVNDMLAAPIMSDANTDMELWIARASNDAQAVRFWLDARGDPCPTPQSSTNISDGAGGTVPCPADSPRLAPGSFAGTPNLDGSSLPPLNLVAPDGAPVSAQAAANDEFANYMLHEQWAMGSLDLTIDQSFLGDDAPITLDTDALSLFVPDFRRADVAALVPVGSRVAIEISMPLPPVVSGRQDAGPIYDLAVGEMNWRVLADADGDPATGYETLLFNAAVSLRAPAGIQILTAASDNDDDRLVLDLGSPSVLTDITENPLVINEGSLRNTISTLINLALPMLTGSLSEIVLPANTVRFLDAEIQGASDDFLVLSGDLIQTITLTRPLPDETVTSGPVLIRGTVEGLTNSATATVHLWLPGDTVGRPVTIPSRPRASSLTFSTDLAISALPMGESTLRLVVTDGGVGGKKASMTFVLNQDTTGVTRSGGSDCFGCDSSGSKGGLLLTLLGLMLFFGLFHPRRRSRGVTTRLVAMVAAVALLGLGGCGGCGCDDTPGEDGGLDFSGPKVSQDAVFLISELQIGGEDDGFDVNEDNPGPDNALSMLGSMANESLADAVAEGSVMLLMQFPGLTNLPAPGESGKLDAVIYLGVDLDDDPTNNFSGHETFGIDPASYGPDDAPLIVFEDLELKASANGTVTMFGGPSTFNLAIPMQGSTLELQISPTYIQAILAISPLRSDGIEAQDGLLGGVIPASALAAPIEGLGFAPIDILVFALDVDMNGDGEIDRRATAENEDGLSAGIVFSGVPAYLSDVPLNRPPTITLDPLPDTVNNPWVEVSGTVGDRDGDCMLATVVLSVNGEGALSAPVTAGDAGCVFSRQVRLFLGSNAVRATATDSDGGTAWAQVVTELVDISPPVVLLMGPQGRVTSAEQTITGIATDDVGIMAVQLDINGTLVPVPGSELASDGSFSVAVTLPALGPYSVTALALDLAENVSEPDQLEFVFEDAEEPVFELTAAFTARERVEGGGPWELTAAEVAVEGSVSDNAGLDELDVRWRIDGVGEGPVDFDPESGEFQIALVLPRGVFTLSLEAEDAEANRGYLDGILTIVDRRPPTVGLEAPDPVTRLPVQELVLLISDDWDDAVELTAAAGVRGQDPYALEFDPDTGTFRGPIVLELGGNPVVIEALDTAGNLARVVGNIELIDEEPPSLSVSAPVDESWTLSETVVVTGIATDNIGLPTVSVDVGSYSANTLPAADGSFAIEVPLQMGSNLLTILAVDGAGLLAQETRRIERRDPDAVAEVSLAVQPEVVAIGNETQVLVRAELTRLGGGPIADGTVVAFRMSPEGLGLLSDTSAGTVGGVAEVVFSPGHIAGLVGFTAEAESLEDTASLGILWPSALAIDVCLAEDAAAAGVSFELDATEEANFEPGAPSTDSTLGLGGADAFHVYNRAAVPTMVLVAGTEELIGGAGGSLLARVTWPLNGGFATMDEVVLRDARISDLVGAASDAGASVSVCGLEHLLGALPPRVALTPISSPTAVGSHLVTGTVEAADLAGCQAELILNGEATPIDVTSGSFAHPVSLIPGLNQIRVLVTDAEGRQGADEIQVRYNVTNLAPVVTITSPGSAVTTTAVVVEGTVSDPDDGLVGLVVTVQIGSGTPVVATVDMTTGEYQAAVTLQPGSNLIRVTATDARGAVTIVSQSTSVIDPISPPRITLTEPAEGAVFTTATTTLSGRVDDGGNPATIIVALTLNGASAPITFSPFSRELSATLNLAPGPNVLVVTATDITEQSATVTREVTYAAPNTPPRVTITSPQNGAKYFVREVTVTGTLRDNQPLDQIQSMTVDGIPAIVDLATGNWSAVVSLTKGLNTIVAEAVDAGGLSGSASVDVEVFDPVVVVSSLQIGGPTDGFDVDSNPPHPLSDAGPDNALSSLGVIANAPLQEQIEGTNGDPLILLFEFDGLVQLPATGQSVTVDIRGYMGIDADGDPTNNFTGDASFQIDPASFDPNTGLPILYIANATLRNSFGVLQIDTFPGNPARFQVSIDSTDPPLNLETDPAYLRVTLTLGPKGLTLSPGLLGGVIPASTLATPILVGDLEIVPLELLISDDPSNPVPDVDLDHSGYVNTWDATASNPDGVSVGLLFTAVPASITP